MLDLSSYQEHARLLLDHSFYREKNPYWEKVKSKIEVISVLLGSSFESHIIVFIHRLLFFHMALGIKLYLQIAQRAICVVV